MYSKSLWVRVTKREPCPICGRDHFCTRSADGKLARCTKVESSWTSETRDGSLAWIHRLSEPLPEVKPQEEKPKPKKDATKIAEKCFQDRKAEDARKSLSETLGVSEKTLEDLYVGVGWDRNGQQWSAFPSRDSKGIIIGITRRYPTGEKKTLYGTSNAGVFCKQFWWNGNGTVYVVEGPSDVAALIDAGLAALGRPSNIGGVLVLAEYLKRHVPGRIIVIGENDTKPEKRGTIDSCKTTCTGCLHCAPGHKGAIITASRLSKNLKRKVEVVMPPDEYKDARQWWIGNQLKGLAR